MYGSENCILMQVIMGGKILGSDNVQRTNNKLFAYKIKGDI